MNMAERTTLVIRIHAELQNMGGLKKNLQKVMAVIQRETRGKQKDAARVLSVVEALEFGTTR